jgi:hypothetical protein
MGSDEKSKEQRKRTAENKRLTFFLFKNRSVSEATIFSDKAGIFYKKTHKPLNINRYVFNPLYSSY